MKEALKASVLARIVELAPEVYGNYKYEEYNIERTIAKNTIYADWGSISFRNKDDADNKVWKLAADILGIKPKEERPSDALLWEAYFEAAKMFIGKAGVNYGNIAEIASAEFSAWLATLPADPLKADRELVAEAFEVEDLERELLNDCYNYDLINALKRFAGMEVPNE